MTKNREKVKVEDGSSGPTKKFGKHTLLVEKYPYVPAAVMDGLIIFENF